MKFNFELEEQEANVVLTSLAKQPYEMTAGVIDKLRFQAQSQINAANAPKSEGEQPAPAPAEGK
jgi:hypothetical protein